MRKIFYVIFWTLPTTGTGEEILVDITGGTGLVHHAVEAVVSVADDGIEGKGREGAIITGITNSKIR